MIDKPVSQIALDFHRYVTERKYEWDQKREQWIDKSDEDWDRMSHEDVFNYFLINQGVIK